MLEGQERCMVQGEECRLSSWPLRRFLVYTDSLENCLGGRLLSALPRQCKNFLEMPVSSLGPSFAFALAKFGRLLRVDEVFNYAVKIGIPPGQEQHIIRSDRCPTGMVTEALQIDGHIFWIQIRSQPPGHGLLGRPNVRSCRPTYLCPNHLRQGANELRCCISISPQ